MQISGFIKQSLIDYPGQIASVVFTQGCNFSCPYCHNQQLIPLAEGTIAVSEVLDYLRKNCLLLDAVVISGGEPTLHKDLKQFIARIKQLGLNVKIDSNGSNPSVLSELIESRLIDYVAMDIKSELSEEAYSLTSGVSISRERISKVRQSIQMLIHSGIEHEFRTTVCKELISFQNLERITEEIGECQHYFLQQYQPFPFPNNYKRTLSSYQENEMRDFIRNLPVSFPVFLRE